MSTGLAVCLALVAGYVVGVLRMALAFDAVARDAAADLRFCANGVLKYPERIIDMLNAMAERLERRR